MNQAELQSLQNVITVTEKIKAELTKTHEQIGADGWMIAHYRAGSTCNFGPFDTLLEAYEWHLQIGKSEGVHGNFIALFKTVDWNR